MAVHTRQLDERAAQVAQVLREAGAAFALVLGSRARGTARPDSDPDVAAFWKGQPGVAWDLRLPAGVDLVILNDEPLEWAGTAALEGQVLFEVDEVARVRWVSVTTKIWLDERPRFERSHAEFLEAGDAYYCGKHVEAVRDDIADGIRAYKGEDPAQTERLWGAAQRRHLPQLRVWLTRHRANAVTLAAQVNDAVLAGDSPRVANPAIEEAIDDALATLESRLRQVRKTLRKPAMPFA